MVRVYTGCAVPRFTETGATGEGDALIDGGNPQAPVQVSIANVVVATPSRVKQVYNQAPFFLQFAGQVMIGNPDPTTPTVYEAFPVQWAPGQNYAPAPNQFVIGVFWKLPPGVTADIVVEW